MLHFVLYFQVSRNDCPPEGKNATSIQNPIWESVKIHNVPECLWQELPYTLSESGMLSRKEPSSLLWTKWRKATKPETCKCHLVNTWQKSQSSFYLSPHRRGIEACKAETGRHSLLCHRGSRYQQDSQGNLELSPCKSTLPCRYPRSTMGHSKHTLPPSASRPLSSPGPSDFTLSLQGAIPY